MSGVGKTLISLTFPQQSSLFLRIFWLYWWWTDNPFPDRRNKWIQSSSGIMSSCRGCALRELHHHPVNMRVDKLMFSKVLFLCERFITHLTWKWPQANVYKLMLSKMMFLCKWFFAYFTWKWPHVCMCLFMLHKVFFLFKCFVAHASAINDLIWCPYIHRKYESKILKATN